MPKITTRVRWRTPFDANLWTKFAGFAGKKPSSRSPTNIQVGLALPEGRDGYIADLFGNRNGRKYIYWILNVKPRPDSDPPKNVVIASEKIGGVQGLHKFIEDNIVSSVSIAAFYECRVNLNGSAGWECNLVPSDIGTEQLPSDIGQGGRLEEIGFRFQNGANGLEEFAITYGHQDDSYILIYMANGLLKVGEGMSLPFVSEMTDFLLSRLFVKR